MAAWWEFWEFFSPAFDRWVQSRNTRGERQARAEYEAVLKDGRARYQAKLREIEQCRAR